MVSRRESTFEFRVSSFKFRVSSFEFPVPSFEFKFRVSRSLIKMISNSQILETRNLKLETFRR